ncbi:MAG: DUF302 domain-containing protein [Pirellulaceae bacterium]
MNNELGFEVHMDGSHEQVIERVTESLKTEGFGVLTRIDIDKAFEEKLGTGFRPYTILGACNPQLAHTALCSRPEIGLLLPCNVTVESAEKGNGCLVRLMNPATMMQSGKMGADEAIGSVATDATERLQRVADTLAS